MSWHGLIAYWFGDWDDREPLPDRDPQLRRWWSGERVIDEEVRERFEDDHLRARAGNLDDWTQTAEGTLALVLLLDQVPRNLYRGSAEAFATDARAQQIAVDAIDRGLHRKLSPIQRAFLYMPLMHAEDLALQDRAVALFEDLAAEAATAGWARAGYYRGAADFARGHRDVVARFGRFPHRNAVVGRTSTAEEDAFLAERGRGS